MLKHPKRKTPTEVGVFLCPYPMLNSEESEFWYASALSYILCFTWNVTCKPKLVEPGSGPLTRIVCACKPKLKHGPFPTETLTLFNKINLFM